MSIWIEPISLELLKERGKNSIVDYLDIQFTDIGDDYLTATMPVDHRTKQPLGLLHGGASCVLAESVASMAANFCVNQKEAYCVGLDINANHLRAARTGRVSAVTKPVHLGRRTQVWLIDIFNEAGKQICVSRLTVAVVRRNSNAK